MTGLVLGPPGRLLVVLALVIKYATNYKNNKTDRR